MSKGNRDRAEKARRIVVQQKAAERRRQVTVWTSVAVAVVLLIAGFIGYSTLAGQDKGKLVTPSSAVDDGTAFAVGTGTVVVDLYEDFMCPNCKNFETASGAKLREMATSNKITLRYHVVSILDRASNGTKYSTRSAGAAAAAGEAGKFTEFHDVLYANQPAEGSDGLTNAKIIELATSVGLTGDKFADAVNSGTYEPWATHATEVFSERHFNGTPTVVVNGTQVEQPSLENITQAIDKAAG
ncbi:membrane protein [Actinoplanes ianthinogenes]|uniref:Membrane protein n=1 Tax=Actinoplanes ianthinogenes TaxID=122358 RepID=A0ABN6CGM7_9ACTN|nr:thioredoxin domain-containing protein [Actinoplanes ianthinogenes]BCJ44692.1 membrane protein [Actinoplanes ianthinogenes]GGQ99427.1 membrane protein [Actinoplanes ianthinogenes]